VQTIQGELPSGGVAYEHLIGIANETEKDVWFNVPHLADDNYIRQMARTLRNEVGPQQNVIVEFSNEFWNFSQGPELGRQMIHPDWSWENQQGETLYYGAVAPRLKDVSEIFHQEFGSQEDRLEIVLAGQSENRWHVEKALEWFEDNGHNPRDYIDVLSSAPYFSAAKIRTDYTELNELMDDLVNEGYKQPERAIRRTKELADDYGMKFYAYEGGQHVWRNNVADNDLVEEAQQDPRMGEAYRKYMQLWEEQNPGGLFMHYTLTGDAWGLLSELDQESSPKWDAVMEFLIRDVDDPPVHTDGVILFSDHFSISPSTTGSDGRSGEAGDATSAWQTTGDINAAVRSSDGGTHGVAEGRDATITRTIDATGFHDLKLEVVAFQNGSTSFETLEDLEQLSPNWGDFLRVRIDTGDGWVTVLLDDGAWDGDHTLAAAAQWAAETGNATLTSTGLLSLPAAADDLEQLLIEVTVWGSQAEELWYLDRLTLSGSVIPEPAAGAALLLVGPVLLGRRRRHRKSPIKRRGGAIVLAAAGFVVVSGNTTQAGEYYVTPSGSGPGSGTFSDPWTDVQSALNRLNPGDTLNLRGGFYQPTSTLRLSRSGQPGARITVRSHGNETAIIDGSVMSSGSILQLNNADHVTVQGLRVQNSHNHGIHAYISDHLEILDNRTYNTWGPGIGVWGDAGQQIWSDQVRVLRNRVEKPNHDDAPGYDPSARWAPHEGITIARVSNFEVGYNEVWDGMKEGIDAKGPNRGGLIHRNYVHGLPRVAYYIDGWSDVMENITMRENIAENTRFGFQVTSEDGQEVRNIDIERNLAFDITGDAGIMLHAYENESRVHDISVVNNTIIGGDYGLLAYLPDRFPDEALRDVLIRNNILNADYLPYRSDATIGIVYDHNLENVTTGFEDAAEGDFRLVIGSPAIDAGHPDAAYNDPDGSRNDVGAFYLGQLNTSIERWLTGGTIDPTDPADPPVAKGVLFQDHFNLHAAAPGPVGRIGGTDGWTLTGDVATSIISDSSGSHAVLEIRDASLSRTIDTAGMENLALQIALLQNEQANYETLESHEAMSPSWGDFVRIRVRAAGGDSWTTLLLDHGGWEGRSDAVAAAWAAEAGTGELTATAALALPDWANDLGLVEIELTLRGSQPDELWYLDRFTLFGSAVPEPATAGLLVLPLLLSAKRRPRAAAA
jgi:hypothetical protein